MVDIISFAIIQGALQQDYEDKDYMQIQPLFGKY